MLLTEETPFPGSAALLPAGGTAALLHARGGGVATTLAARPLRWLGRMSYSWYLWHWPVLVFAAILTPDLGLEDRVVAAAFALILSAVTYHALEAPIRFGLTALRPRVILAGAAALSLACAAGAFATSRAAERASHGPEYSLSWLAMRDNGILYKGCFAADTDDRPRECVLGDPGGATRVVLFGDSHAYQWALALDSIGRRRGWQVWVVTRAACAAARVRAFDLLWKGRYDECPRWREAALRRIAGLQPGVVVVASARIYLHGGGPVPARARLSQDEWERGYHDTFAALARAGARPLLLRDTPMPGFNVPDCLARAVHRGRDTRRACSVPRVRALDPAGFAAERAALQGIPAAAVVDLSDELCDRDVCATEATGVPLYFDDNHLTATAVARLAPVLEARLAAFAPRAQARRVAPAGWPGQRRR